MLFRRLKGNCQKFNIQMIILIAREANKFEEVLKNFSRFLKKRDRKRTNSYCRKILL